MEESLCVSSKDHYHKSRCFFKTQISLGIFKIYLQNISKGIVSLQFLPNPVNLNLLSSAFQVYEGCLQHCFCPCEGYSCHKAPIVFCYHPCSTACIPASQTTSLACRPGHQKRHCCFSVTFEPKGKSKTSPSTWMFWLGYRTLAQIKCHCK